MVYCIALTGNIASGKSTIAALFANFGVDVISADNVSKELTASGTVTLEKIVEHFGSSILLPSKELNRRSLRSIIFADESERIWLESLLHPLIRKKIQINVTLCKSPYCIIEMPLLPNIKDYPYINRILFVKTPQNLQIARLIKRDDCTQQEAFAILATQAKLNEHQLIADDVIENIGSKDALQRKIQNLHARYLIQASAS